MSDTYETVISYSNKIYVFRERIVLKFKVITVFFDY